ncbi:MAG: glycine--tRNA ligase [Alphaproteobacteria bacterium]|nr:glycine--tRNA ligase [Alphaproteobacteria bacterium]
MVTYKKNSKRISLTPTEDIVTFAKRKGFVYPSSEIYGGFAGVYDYGPVGMLLLNNIKKEWLQSMVQDRTDIYGLDSGIVTHPRVWEASGHTKGFTDPLVINNKTHERYRADHLLEEIGVACENVSFEEFVSLWNTHKHTVRFPQGVSVQDVGDPTYFNLLAKTNLGSVTYDTQKEEIAYLRGETCQGIYLNYKNVYDTMHPKLPFGIAQIGKAFRNEISPRQFLFRCREFEQMEMQYFIYPGQSKKYFGYFKKLRMKWLISLGLSKKKLRFLPHSKLVFYAQAAEDIQFQYSFGWKELEGVHDRGNYDLTQHAAFSKQKLAYFDEKSNTHLIPHIIETSIGAGRLFYALLEQNYTVQKVSKEETRIVLTLAYHMAPYQMAVFPLFKKTKFQKYAKKIFTSQSNKYSIVYDDTGSIGKRYRRQDEIGTPYCITVDEITLKKNTVTVRNRDTMKQKRIPVSKISTYIEKELIAARKKLS